MDLPDFSGPFGGVVAGAFIAGCIAGYSFARETIVKMANNRLDQYESKIKSLQDHIDEQERRCDERLKASEKRYDKKIKWLEDRVIEIEESRLNIALGINDNDDITAD